MTTYALSEGHKFRGPSSDFLYLVPSGGIFALDPLSSAILCTPQGPVKSQLADVSAALRP